MIVTRMKSYLVVLILFGVSCSHTVRQASVPAPVADELHGSPEERADDAARYFLGERLAPGMTEIPIDRYLTARERIAAMPKIHSGAARAAGALERLEPRFAATSGGWTNVGPGNVGGRTRSIVINPQNPNIIYAGSVTGGVWKTTDGGQSWNATFDSQSLLNVGALVMDPSDPNTLYAGTGEWYQSWPGNGIYKTTDGGQTWAVLPATSNTTFEYVNKLAISPNNHLRLYAAGWAGVWTSGDGGNTWSSLLGTKTAYYGCQDLAVRPDMNPDVVFAACSGPSASADWQVFQDTSAPSANFVQVMTQPGMGRTSLAIAPSQPGTIYALAADYNAASTYYEGLLGVYRSTSGGGAGTWVTQVDNTNSNLANTLLLNDVRNSTTAFCSASGGAIAPSGGQGNYDIVIAVDPTNPNTVWAGGVDVFRSDDAGQNWGVASLWQVAYGNPQFAHADRHAIVFHPNYDGDQNQTMYLGTDGGVFRTDNARAAVSTGNQNVCQTNFMANSAVRWVDLNNSYVATQFYHGFAYPGGMSYMGGAQDNSVSRGTDNGAINGWTLFSTGDGTVVGIDPADANHVLQSKQHLALDRATDGGTFVSSTAGITEAAANFPFVPALASDPNEGNRWFLGGTVNLWRSLDGGATWTAAAPVEAKSSVTAISVSPADSNTVLFGTQLGFIYSSASALSTDGSTQWTSVQPRANAKVASLAFDPTNPKIVYATYSTLKSQSSDAHVYKSMDGGVTWSPSDGSQFAAIPDVPVFRILVNPYDPTVLYLGSDLGVFVSTNGGATWGHDPNDFANVIVEDLAFDQATNPNWLFAFSYGRGTYRTQLAGSQSPNCTYTVSPATINADAYGGVSAIEVSAPQGCAWSGIPGSTPSAFHVQSPAQGVGPSQAFITIEPNTTGAARSDTLVVANQSVTVNQTAAGTVSRTAADSSTSPAPLATPGIAQIGNSGLTSTASDPQHSCTGSADFRTAWWQVTPGSTGTLEVIAAGRSSAGNSGIVVTAYPASNGSKELACGTAPHDSNSQTDAVIRFAVTSGQSYWIEVSATGSDSTYTGTITLSDAMVTSPDVTIAVTPGTASVAAGGAPLQFTAEVANVGNTGVRWSIAPPLGSISQSGVYTPPASVSGSTAITVTAVTFGVPQKQATATVNLTPAPGGGGPAPSISSVYNNASGGAAIAENTWITISGTNLAPDTRLWGGSDFIAGQMPAQLDGVSVLVNGRAAYVDYISPTQVNALAPLDGTVGEVKVTLATNNGVSQPVTVQKASYAPAFFLFGKYVAATHANGDYLGPASLGSGFTPAAPGETVLLYGSGFGEVNPGILPGAASQAGSLPSLPAITIGGASATVQFAGAISPGLYQFNVVVPANAVSGDNAVTVTYQGAAGPPGMLVSVR